MSWSRSSRLRTGASDPRAASIAVNSGSEGTFCDMVLPTSLSMSSSLIDRACVPCLWRHRPARPIGRRSGRPRSARRPLRAPRSEGPGVRRRPPPDQWIRFAFHPPHVSNQVDDSAAAATSCLSRLRAATPALIDALRTTLNNHAAGSLGNRRCVASFKKASWTTSSGASHHWRA